VSKIDLAGLAAPMLTSGEEVLGAVRVNWNGMVPPTQTVRAGGLTGLGMPGAGVDAETSTPEPPDPDALVAFPSAKQLGLVLTGGRILAWSLGFSGKPKEMVGVVPLSAVTEVSLDNVRMGGLMRFVMKSGAIVDLEALRGEPVENFHAQLQYLIGPS
jgi:hypothetical protein